MMRYNELKNVEIGGIGDQGDRGSGIRGKVNLKISQG